MDRILSLAPFGSSPNGNWFLLQQTAASDLDDQTAATTMPDQSNITAFASRLCARELSNRDQPMEIVLVIPSFASPGKTFLEQFARAQDYTAPVVGDRNTFWIGYGWTSESPGDPVRTNEEALPAFASADRKARNNAILAGAVALVAAVAFWKFAWALGLISAAFFLAALAISGGFKLAGYVRQLAYFRNSYRASNGAVLDLVEFVRRLDFGLDYCQCRSRVQLNIVAHGMGARIATQAIRILSDVFDPKSIKHIKASASTEGYEGSTPMPMRKILPEEYDFQTAIPPDSPAELGKHLSLRRLVLVAPDLPIQEIVTDRPSYTTAAIRRFHETYVLTNGGDAALSVLGGLASYFQFPSAKSWASARLGNLRIVAEKGTYGVMKSPGSILRSLVWGEYTLHGMQFALRGALGLHGDERYVGRCTFVDCTEFRPLKWTRDVLAHTERSPNSASALGWQSLRSYLAGPRGIDCHGAYLDFEDTAVLIFGLTSLGLSGLSKQIGGKQETSEWLAGIRIRLAPAHLPASKPSELKKEKELRTDRERAKFPSETESLVVRAKTMQEELEELLYKV